MSENSFLNASEPDIIDAYRAAASLHGRYSEDGDYKKANAEAEQIAAAYRELRRRGPASQRELLRLVGDDDLHVRAWAGAHALEFAADVGEPVLEDLAGGSSVAAFNAKMTLREWRQGTLSFP